MQKKEWVYKKPDPKKVEELSRAMGISSILATLLVNRNLTAAKEVESFLNPDYSHFYNPFLLPDMEKAVLRVREAIERGEKILIYGDRDVDGVTALSILVRTLKSLGAQVDWLVPSREGYGLHRPLLEKCFQSGVRLVITVDCGTSAVEEIEFARTLGLDVIVTDHHLPPPRLPNACAIINPNREDSLYPAKEAAGCLIAFKFAYALMFSFNRNFNQDYCILDFETTGLSSGNDQILEIGSLQIRNFLVQEEFHTMVRPTCPISDGAIAVHGITEEMVEDAPPIEDVLPKLLKFIGNRTIVAHNARFDLGFLRSTVRRVHGREFSPPFLDTLPLARSQFPSFPSHALQALAWELRYEPKEAHRALGDCHTTAYVFQRAEELRDPRLRFYLDEMLDLAALGTVADIVPLQGENRMIVRYGLSALIKSRKAGVRKLMESAGFQTRGSEVTEIEENDLPTAKEIAWKVTPLINAAGRFLKPELSVQLLLSDSEREASSLVKEISALNESRKDLQKTNSDHFSALVRKQVDLKKEKIIFLVAEGVEHGVTGIVASRMVQEFGRPVFLLIAEGDLAAGSSRSVPGFNVVHALKECDDLLLRYGGHPQAAGLAAPLKNVDLLKERLLAYADRTIVQSDFSQKLEIDCEIGFGDLSPVVVREIRKMEPFGEGNPPPIFSVKQVQVEGHTLIGADRNHLKIRLTEGETFLDAVGWGMSALANQIKKGDSLDCVFQLESGWKKRSAAPQLVLADLRTTTYIKT
ncbi:MAG: single-stranded-DNA-specific exonuclease RecJ [Elusimicrobia bacterium]|nr:single-stranded-DNA-specific exonuclease RecJ [Elusimicrobiota bacterium]